VAGLRAWRPGLSGPFTRLPKAGVDVWPGLVGCAGVWGVLAPQPPIPGRRGAVPLPGGAGGRGGGAAPAPPVEFDRVSFRYPSASEVSLASLESIALPMPERAGSGQDVLHEVSFTAPSGQLTALVGPSGAGKTTITHLVARL